MYFDWLNSNLIENIVKVNGSYSDYVELSTTIFPKLVVENVRSRIFDSLKSVKTEYYKKNGEAYFRIMHLLDGQYHRDGDMPAKVRFYGYIVVSRKYMRHGKYHRDGDKPAFNKYHKVGGGIKEECWFVNGKEHRNGREPAVIFYHVDGTIIDRGWFKYGHWYNSSIYKNNLDQWISFVEMERKIASKQQKIENQLKKKKIIKKK